MKSIGLWSKWIAAAGVAAVMVGCSGDGGGGGVVIPPGGTSRSVPLINLGTNSTVSVVYLSGQDRRSRAVGSQIADIQTIQLQNGPSDFVPGSEQITSSTLSVQLDGYTINQRDISIPMAGQTEKNLTEYPLVIDQLREVTDSSGSTVLRSAPGTFAYETPFPFDVRVKVLPGRQTSLQVRLDDLTVQWLPGQNVVFDEDRFTNLNYDPVSRSIKGFLSDYLSFDISGVASGERPNVDSTGNPAERIYFSGDGIAISEGLGVGSVFELLDPIAIKSGTVIEGATIAGKKAANTYKLDETDPGLNLKTALLGTWKNYSDIVTPTDTVSMISLPGSEEDDRETLVLFRRNSAGRISGMWHGYVDYSTTDLTTGIFRLFPISTLASGQSSGDEVAGTVSGVVRSNGVVIRANWDATGTIPGSFSFPTSGAYAVVR